MNYHKNAQTGSAHAVIIIVLVVALLGALGVVFYQNFIQKQPPDSAKQKTADNAQDTPAKADSTPKVADETGYLVIKEWDVRLPARGVLSDAVSQVVGGTQADGTKTTYVYLSTKKLIDICGVGDRSAYECSIAAISRGKADDTDSGPEGPVKYKDIKGVIQVGDYYYRFSLGNGLVSDDPQYQLELRRAFREAFGKITAR